MGVMRRVIAMLNDKPISHTLSHDVRRSEFRDKCLVFQKQQIYQHPGLLLF